jgi:ATP-dependent protease ClpP protease subunit
MNWILLVCLLFAHALHVDSTTSRKIVKKPSGIVLDEGNFVFLKGAINRQVVSKFMNEFLRLDHRNVNYIFINSPGGSVDDGSKIVSLLSSMNNIVCIAERAYSMAFVIFQACNERVIMHHGSIMQHQMSYGVHDDKERVESYVSHVSSINRQLSKLQAKRIGVSVDYFKKKTLSDWWLYGENAIDENCADTISAVICTNKLIKMNYTEEKRNYKYVYSKCPLIMEHIDKIKTSNSSESDLPFFFNFEHEHENARKYDLQYISDKEGQSIIL